ncbi:MAG: hypothetical protein WAM60_17550 [Candidatus Promineifilaceae bacterium]
MTKHLYLSLMPEALIASMLSPEDFGLYFAIGQDRTIHDQAVFIELDPDYRSDDFRIDEGFELCVPHDDGAPKKSVYISVYRVLERISLDAMKKLYLVTAHGQVLGLEASNDFPADNASTYMYQEIAPVQPLVVSTLGAKDYAEFISQDADNFVHLPAVAFVDLQLGKLAEDPETGSVDDLPYSYIPHLRECLFEVRTKMTHTKIVHRVHATEFPYRMIKHGIFISQYGGGMVFYAMPSRDELRSKYYRWWRSANR